MAPPHLRFSLVSSTISLLIMSTLSTPVLLLDASQAIFEHPAPKLGSHSNSGLPFPNSTHSFWINTPGANPLAKEGSEGDLTRDTDVCIIGSGITGVSAAYHLAKAFEKREGLDGPVKAVILDARDFCSGATGRNGGHLTPVHFNDFVEREQIYGREEAKKAYDLEYHTVSELVKIIEAQNWKDAVDLVSSEHIGLLVTEQEVESAKLDFAAASAAGLDLKDVQWLRGDEVQATYGATFPAFSHPGNNLWPLKLVTHLYNHAQQLNPNKFNLTLHTNTPVTSISPSFSSPSSSSSSTSTSCPRRWSLSTPRGIIQCSYVLHATNAYASHLLPQFYGPKGIVPTRGQVLAMRAAVPAKDITRASWGGNQGFEYWFPRPVKPGTRNPGDSEAEENPLVILGGGREASGPRFETYVTDDSEVNVNVGKVLREFLPGMFPGKYEQGREPDMEWTGIMGYTKIGDPFVGPVVGPNNSGLDSFTGQFVSAGYTGHGMPRAFACAEAVAGMITADITGEIWTTPEWLPRHFLTTDPVRAL